MENRIKGRLVQVISKGRNRKNETGVSSEVIEAARLVAEMYPGRMPVGYCVVDDVIVVMTRIASAYRKSVAPAMFAVTKSGEVRGITPMVYHLESHDMKKIPRWSLRRK